MNILVLGGGISGVSAANLAFERGFSVTLSESKPETPFLSDLNPAINLVTGTQTDDLLDEVHLIVISPGIPFTIPIIKEALARDIEIISEVEFALKYYEGTVIGITGTNGKSTTTAMTAHALRGMGQNAVECGNIGETVANVVLEGQKPDILVIELSSYQLHSSRKLVLDAGAILNFTTDHLAYHGSMAEYFKAKAKICQFNRGKVFVYETFAEDCRTYNVELPQSVVTLSRSAISDHMKTLSHLASHDQMNGLFAGMLAAAVTKMDLDTVLKNLSSFQSLPHRFQRYFTPNSHVYINDSKATNVDSTMTALRSIEGKTVLLLGGQGKGESFKPLLQFKDKIEHVYFFGESADQLEKDLSALGNYTKVSSLSKLFHIHGSHLKSAVSVLFSPACASFDEFQNYGDRGDFFVSAMSKLYN